MRSLLRSLRVAETRRTFARRNCAGLWLLLALSMVPSHDAVAQHVNPDFWVASGAVEVTRLAGNTLYCGGFFSYVGPYRGGGVPVQTATGTPLTGFPKVRGSVNAVVADGQGGWFIGGHFDSVGGVPRANLAHIQSDLTVNPWNPGVAFAGTVQVRALALDGSILYVGGAFDAVGGQSRLRLAAIDASSGAVTPWNPGSQGDVLAILVANSTVYAGGMPLGTIGGQIRSCVAALDPVTGSATSWNPNITGNGPTVNALALNGAAIYVGGTFDYVGGLVRLGLAAIDVNTGLATAWNSNVPVHCTAMVLSGSLLYVAGANTLLALDAVTGLFTGWNALPGGPVNCVAVSGSTVYAGGAFVNIGGQARNRVAAIDASTALATSWNPNAGPDVACIAIAGSTVYVGGSFESVGGVNRSNAAAIDVATGMATSWDPPTDGIVAAIAVSGQTVYLGGGFLTVGGLDRHYIAAVDATTGLASAWDPDANAGVSAIAVSGSVVYAGGTFTSIGGQPRSRIAALDATTGAATAWNPNPVVSPFGSVAAIVPDGSTIYAGGEFTGMGGQARNNIAALSASTGLATSWNPNASARVYRIALAGPLVYVGGLFTNVGGQARNHLAALDATTGTATGWDPNLAGFGSETTPHEIVPNGSSVYLCGEFTTVAGLPRQGLAAIDAASGLPTPWAPSPGGIPQVRSLALGTSVYVGGWFSDIGGVPGSGIAAISVSPNLIATETRPGWSGPIVPRNSGGATPAGAALTPTLDGNVADTYFNASYHQLALGPVPAWKHQVYVDDVLKIDVNEPANSLQDQFYYSLNGGPYVVQGGRHTLKTIADPDDALLESIETDNIAQGQFVWSPLVTAPGVAHLRAAPPVAGSLAYPNSDGFQFDHDPSVPWVVGLVPVGGPGGDNYDLYLYSDYVGSTSGFSTLIGLSNQGGNVTDFVGGGSGAPVTVYPAAVRASGGASLCAVDQGHALGHQGAGTYAAWLNQPLAPFRVVDVYETALTQNQGYSFLLRRTAGTTDLEFAIFREGAIFSRGGAMAYSSPLTGSIDVLTFIPVSSERYAIVVYRPTGDDAASAATYDFYWSDQKDVGVSGENLPTVLALAPPAPNPVRDRTRFELMLPRPGHARLSVYDVAGREIRTVLDRDLPAGVYAEAWNVTDADGARVAPGIYWAQLWLDTRMVRQRFAVLR